MSETHRALHDPDSTRPPKLPEQVHEPRRSLPATRGWLVPTDPPAV
ncbi:MAG: hypothetical protein JNL12_18665 [Planctomycetes bacterium]|nr:hypothetical protein [Planctomycetota bacterium]